MIKLCMNCDTENAVDAVICSGCGMSLTRAGTAESAATRMRWIARALALAFGALTTIMLATTPRMWESLAAWEKPFGELTGWGSWAFVLIGVLALGSWAVVARSWRWDAVGGVLLVLWAGLVVPVGYDLLLSEPLKPGPAGAVYGFVTCFPGVFLLTLPAGLPAWIAGSLILARWWESRAPDRSQDTG